MHRAVRDLSAFNRFTRLNFFLSGLCFGLQPGLFARHFSLQLGLRDLGVLLILGGLTLRFGHCGFLHHLSVRRQLRRGLLLTLLRLLHNLREPLLELRKRVLGIQLDMRTRHGVNLVDHGCVTRVFIVVDRFAVVRLRCVGVCTVDVPQRHVLFDVFDQIVQVIRVCDRRLSKHRIQSELHVILNVRNMVLRHVSVGCLPDKHGRILVRRSALLRCGHVFHDFVNVRDFHLLERTRKHFFHVEELGICLRKLQNRLHLRHPLRFRENMRVRHRNNVGIARKIIAADRQIRHHVGFALFI